jgi:hypothetical protein
VDLATPPQPTFSRRKVAGVAAGVAAAAAVGATVFGVLALREKSSYDGTPTYANTDNGDNFAAYTDGCIALAVAAGVTSLVLYLTRDTTSAGDPAAAGPKKPAAAFSLSPLVTAHAGGAGALLRFEAIR